MDEPTRFNRREAMAGAGGLLVASGAFPLTSVAARMRKLPRAGGGRFPHGVAAGFPAANGAVLWTRLDDFDGPRGTLRLEVATDPGFSKVLLEERVIAQRAHDYTVHHRVASKRLKPGEQYFYRFYTQRGNSRVGRFRTPPPADSNQPFRIGYFSCQRYEHGYFNPHHHLANEDLDLVISLGDYIYEEDAGAQVPERVDPSGEPNGHVETLEQFRSRHATYRRDKGLRRMHANHAVVSIWDDCEVEGNWAGDGPSSGPSPVGERAIPFEEKRLNGMRAYFEWFPYARSPRLPARIEKRKIYRSLRYGKTAELMLLDTRKYRDPQPCEDYTFDRGAPCDELEDPRKRLGPEQLAWLKARLTDSAARWKVLGNAQMMMALDVAPGSPAAVDGWDGYAAERRELLGFARAEGVSDIVSIVGDVHVFFAGDLRTDGRITGDPVGTEFVGASISHNALTLPGLSEEQSALVTENLPVVNPHLKFAHFRRHGYVVTEFGDERATFDFRVVDSVLEESSPVSTLARFEVLSGVPECRQLSGRSANMIGT
jgi:alkaline phosphatase D